jgi:hypothetical protein
MVDGWWHRRVVRWGDFVKMHVVDPDCQSDRGNPRCSRDIDVMVTAGLIDCYEYDEVLASSDPRPLAPSITGCLKAEIFALMPQILNWITVYSAAVTDEPIQLCAIQWKRQATW